MVQLNDILDPVMRRRLWRRWSSLPGLSLEKKGEGSDKGPVLFAVMRNEMLRLPRFLEHYRKLGVSRFFVVENNSTDGTDSYLRRQADVGLYRSRDSFARKEAWIDILLRRHGARRWCVVADADELLDFPGLAESGLAALGDFLGQNGWNALHAILLDLYPPGPVAAMSYRAGDDYRAYEWYFDPFTTLRRVPRAFWKGSGLDYRFEGGTRERVFGVSNCCSKFPFFEFGRGMFLHDGQHYLEGAHIAPARGVLYHFKYLQDFVPHAREEAVRGEHWQGAREYARYVEACDAAGNDFTLRNANSVKFTGINQLQQLGFATVPEGWMVRPSPRTAASDA